MKYFYWASALILGLVLAVFALAPAFAGKLAIPSQISFGSFAIRLYGITLALGILTGYLVARKNSWRFGISASEVDDIAFWITVAGIIGARIYYVIFDWKLYASDYSEIYKIWHGGISIYGGIIAGLAFIFFYTRKKAYSVYQLLDMAALSMPLAQAVGRFGNFFNQEAFGAPTSLPWKMYIDPSNRPLQYRQYDFFQPTFLYEAVLDVAIFFILRKLLGGRIKTGVLAFAYLGLYSTARFFIESVRLDSSYIGNVKVDQVTAILAVLTAGFFIFMRQWKIKGAWEGQ